MPRVLVGYGEYQGYRIAELPAKAVEDLAKRYPLSLDEKHGAECEELVITVAVHAELHRRANGGAQERRVPTLRELAEEIVTRGYQQASKHHHPDGKGHHDAQVLLTQARDELRNAANSLSNDTEVENATIIPAPVVPRARAASPPGGISDDDVPF
jgi:hypothetical protein